MNVRDDTVPPPDADAAGWSPWHRHAGPWTFDFELDVDGGTTLTPDAVATVDGVRVGVTRLIAASNIVRVELSIDGAPRAAWTAVGTVEHGRVSRSLVVGTLASNGPIVMMTDGGVGDPSGAWTVRIDEIVAGDRRIAGPWVIDFQAP